MPVSIFSQIRPDVAVSFHIVEGIRVSERSTPTSHPVETGADVTDHIQRQPTQVFLSGAKVSETPYAGAQAAFTVDLVTTRLEQMRTFGLVTLVVPGLGTFRDMSIASLDYDKKNKKERVFEIATQHIRLASPVSVAIPVRTPPPPQQVGFPDKLDAGAQPPVDPTAPVDRSLIDTLLGGLAG